MHCRLSGLDIRISASPIGSTSSFLAPRLSSWGECHHSNRPEESFKIVRKLSTTCIACQRSHYAHKPNIHAFALPKCKTHCWRGLRSHSQPVAHRDMTRIRETRQDKTERQTDRPDKPEACDAEVDEQQNNEFALSLLRRGAWDSWISCLGTLACDQGVMRALSALL